MLINDIPFQTELMDILTELKYQLDLNGISLLAHMKETTQDIMISCPYHKGGQERRPSAGIRKSDGQFHCLACGETHSLQEVISYCFGYVDDIVGAEGWKWLLKNFLTVSVEERKPIQLNLSRGVLKSDTIQYVSEAELDSYRYYHPYMWKRGLTKELVDIFDIGYDSTSECITFPVRDIYGRTLFVARRSVNTKFFNYPKNAQKPLYGLYELTQSYTRFEDLLGTSSIVPNYPFLSPWSDTVIVTESMLDAITAWKYGSPAVALNGTGDEFQFNQLKSLPCRKLILATDNDEAGKRARKKIRSYIKNKIITEYVFPENKKDLNDLTEDEFKSLQEVF